MRNIKHKIDEINGLLGLFAQYWPTFTIQTGMSESWAHALIDYSREELWESLKQFRAEEQRVFAPTISELIGRTDTLREIHKKKASDALLLEPPKRKRSEYEPMETYAYTTTRTTPKKNKDEPDTETRKAVRMSAERRKEIERRKTEEGYRKVTVPLGNGRYGFEWVR